MDTNIERDNSCFCCGIENDRGFHLHFSYPAQGEAESSLLVPEWCAGWKGVTHGGFLTMLMDELMAHAGIAFAASAVTAEMSTKFLKPVPTGSTITIKGRAEKPRGRIITTTSSIHAEDGSKLAEATARFIIMEKRAE
jgi:acyl-coenzyme A thioesterase PaaI-like protein